MVLSPTLNNEDVTPSSPPSSPSSCMHTGRWDSVSMRELLTRMVPQKYTHGDPCCLSVNLCSRRRSPVLRRVPANMSGSPTGRARTDNAPYERMQQEVRKRPDRPIAPLFARRWRGHSEARTTDDRPSEPRHSVAIEGHCSVPCVSRGQCTENAALSVHPRTAPRCCTRDSQDHRQLPTVLPQGPGSERWVWLCVHLSGVRSPCSFVPDVWRLPLRAPFPLESDGDPPGVLSRVAGEQGYGAIGTIRRC